MIPDCPSASYLADGLVITSTRSIMLACSCLSPAPPLKETIPDGFPSIKILTLLLPLNFIAPSGSTVTEGIFIKMS